MKIVIEYLSFSLFRITNRIMAYISLEWPWTGGHPACGSGGGGKVVFSFSWSENDKGCLVLVTCTRWQVAFNLF